MLSCARLHQIGQIARIIRESKPKDYFTKKICSYIFTNAHFSSMSKSMQADIHIPVPYGQITGKSWGDKNGQPVLALHGLFDNCGTFDKMIPLLSESLQIIAIDLPGHGNSSHRPAGCFYSFLDMMVDLKRIIKFFDWKQPPHLIGHSSGGELALMFAGLFPKEANKLVIIDTIKTASISHEDVKKCFAKAVEDNLKLEQKLSGSPPIYSKDSALQRLIEGTYNEIEENNAKILMSRGIRLSDCGKGYVFTRDLRMRTLEDFNVLTHEALKCIMKGIENEILLIKSLRTSPYYIFKGAEVNEDFINLYKSSSKKFEMQMVDENHFSHLNNPQLIADMINKFIC